MKSKKITSASSEYWDSLYNIIDALRAGAGSFDCASQEAYDWCMDVTTLANLVPAACLAITIKCRKKEAVSKGLRQLLLFKMESA